MCKRITVKIGSNVLTRENGTLDVTRMSALVDQVVELNRRGIEVIVVSSGAVASGRSELRRDPRALDAVAARQLFSAIGQAKLMNRYFDLFRGNGSICGQVLTTKEIFSTRMHYRNQKRCMDVMLENGVVPIVNENDTISLTELMFTDNDELSGLVAKMMNADKLIILSNIDGIFDGDPADPKSKVIREVFSETEGLNACIKSTKSQFGRGGMLTKCNIARHIAEEGIEVVIANGKVENILLSLIENPTGTLSTRFVARSEAKTESKELMKRSITIRDSAAKNLETGTPTSIYSEDVIGVAGEFFKDEVVRVKTPDGAQIGVGRVLCSNEEVSRLMNSPERHKIIHYDYLFLD